MLFASAGTIGLLGGGAPAGALGTDPCQTYPQTPTMYDVRLGIVVGENDVVCTRRGEVTAFAQTAERASTYARQYNCPPPDVPDPSKLFG